MLRKFLLAHLSERGPGVLIDDLVLKLRRNSYKEKEIRELIVTLRTEGVIEQIGQYVWLEKGVAECLELTTRPKRYRILSYASRVG